MGLTLHQHGHTHGGGSSHSHMNNNDIESLGHKDHEETNINVRAAYIHVIGDFIQSFGVLVAAFVIYYKVSNVLSVLVSGMNLQTYILL